MKPSLPVTLAGVVFVAVNVLVSRLEPHFLRVATYDRQFTAAHVFGYRAAPPPDIVLMGMSRVAVGLDPAILEEEVFLSSGRRVKALNLGIAGGTIDLQYLVLKNVIRPDAPPPVIVYGLSEGELNSLLARPGETVASRLPYYSLLLRPDDFHLYGGATLDKNVRFVLERLVPIYRDHELIRTALSIQFNPDNPSHKYYAPGPEHWTQAANGFRPLAHGVGTPADVEHARREYAAALPAFRFRGPQLDRLHDFLGLARARGIKVVLVNMPVTPLHRSFWGRPALVQEYVGLVREVAQQHRVPLLDLYADADADANIPPDDFFDTHHLDERGAEILSRLVARRCLVSLFPASGAWPHTDMADFYRADLSDLRLPERMTAGQSYTGGVLVRNASGSPWPGAGARSVRVAYHWLDGDGREIVHDGLRTVLPAMAPGQSEAVRFEVASPPQAGAYLLEIDLVYEGVGWFGDHGSTTLRRRLDVGGEP